MVNAAKIGGLDVVRSPDVVVIGQHMFVSWTTAEEEQIPSTTGAPIVTTLGTTGASISPPANNQLNYSQTTVIVVIAVIFVVVVGCVAVLVILRFKNKNKARNDKLKEAATELENVGTK